MKDYTIIGIDLAKTKFHIAAINKEHKVVLKKAITRQDFFAQVNTMFHAKSTFAFEACGGAHFVARKLQELDHNVILLKPKDVKAYAKSRQKNDLNDAIAICKTALDPDLMHVKPKMPKQQIISYLHKTRQNVIRQRIQRTNSIITSLQEFGYIVTCSKSEFISRCKEFVKDALEQSLINSSIYKQMIMDYDEALSLIARERSLDKEIIEGNKNSKEALILQTIPGIGPINASILSIKPMEIYKSSKDFAASIGLVPRQNTTGGVIRLGSITKQGDRYARTMLIQGARSVVMRSTKPNVPQDKIYQFVQKLKEAGKRFNVICVAVANKLARIAYACVVKQCKYSM